jgi:hypothetical protein
MYCGMHMRTKKVSSWVTASTLRCIIKFQAIVRGGNVREYNDLAGPGVIDRRECHNDSDVVTCEDKRDVHPSNYFSVEEDGKVWWFDQRTIFQWSQKDLVVQNPYTRTPFSKEDTCRLRRIVRYRKGLRKPLYHEGQPTLIATADIRDNRWLRVCQVLREFDFPLHHEHFISLSYPAIVALINSIIQDTRYWTDPHLQKYHTILRNLRNIMHTYNSEKHLSLDVATVLLSVLVEMWDSEEFATYINTAYHCAYNYNLHL